MNTPAEAICSFPPYSIANIEAIVAVGIPDITTSVPSISGSDTICLSISQENIGMIINLNNVTGIIRHSANTDLNGTYARVEPITSIAPGVVIPPAILTASVIATGGLISNNASGTASNAIISVGFKSRFGEKLVVIPPSPDQPLYEIINTPSENCAPHILNVSFDRIKSEVLLHSLEQEGIFVSSGSACSSHKKDKRSYVLQSMKIPDNWIDGSIRFSLSEFITENEINYVLTKLKEIVQKLRTIR